MRPVSVLIMYLFGSLFCTAAPSIYQTIQKFPLAFESVNEGFIARGQGYQISIRDGNIRLAIQSRDLKQPDFISMNFVGGRSVRAILGTELPGKVNDFRTQDRRRWRTGISTYESVRY